MFLLMQKVFSLQPDTGFFRILKYLLVFSCLAGGCVHSGLVTPGSAITGEPGKTDLWRAVAQIDWAANGRHYPARVALIMKNPSYLRLEIIPVIGTPDFFLAASPAKMSIFIPSQGKYYYGQPTADNLGRFLPWKFDIEDIVMIFSGICPVLKEKNIAYQKERDKHLMRVEMKAPSGASQVAWTDENGRLYHFVRRDETGKDVYAVRYFYNATGGSIPEKIDIDLADGKTSLSVKYLDVTMDKTADLSVFDLVPPDNVAAIPLE